MSEFHLSHRGIVEFFNAIIGNPTSESAPYRAHLIAAYGEEGARRTTQSFFTRYREHHSQRRRHQFVKGSSDPLPDTTHRR